MSVKVNNSDSRAYERDVVLEKMSRVVKAFNNGANSIKEALENADVSYTLYAKCILMAQAGDKDLQDLLVAAGPHIGKRGRKADPNKAKKVDISPLEKRLKKLEIDKDIAIEKLEEKKNNILNAFLFSKRQIEMQIKESQNCVEPEDVGLERA